MREQTGSGPNVRRFNDADALARAVADAFLDLVARVQAESPDRLVQIVLTGGTIADVVHRCLRDAASLRGAVDWSRVVWWWGDERFVAADSPDRNAGQAHRALLDHVAVDPHRVHPMPAAGSGPLPEAAVHYAQELTGALGSRPFDLVMLGIGPDGHVASLFPHHPALADLGDTVAVPDSPKPPPERISLTFPRLNNAEQVWILASGDSKRDAVEALLASDGSPGATVQETPARALHGLSPTSLTLWTDLPHRR